MKLETIGEKGIDRLENHWGYMVPDESEYKVLAESCGWHHPRFADIGKYFSDFIRLTRTEHPCIQGWVAKLKKNGPTELQHFTFDKCCESMLFKDDVLCIRYVKSKNKLIAAKHKMGMCPFCVYEWPEGIEP